MSNYHILSGSDDGNTYQVVFHVAIPNTSNAVGTNWRTAVMQYRRLPDGTLPKSMVPFITAPEQTQLDNGELVEDEQVLSTNPGQTLVNKRDALDALYTVRQSSILAKWQDRLRYWGYNRDVP